MCGGYVDRPHLSGFVAVRNALMYCVCIFAAVKKKNRTGEGPYRVVPLRSGALADLAEVRAEGRLAAAAGANAPPS